MKLKNKPSRSFHIIEPNIKKFLDQRGCGSVFTPRDFSELGDQRSVAMALTRLTRKGIIRSISRGLYDYPFDHPTLGRLSSSTEAIIKVLTQRDAVRVQPTGNYAMNLLGISEQVPKRIVLLTDGPSRSIKIGSREIIFKRTTPKNMATAGRKSGLIIQALRSFGKNRIDDEIISVLNRHLTDGERQELEADLQYAPVWIAKILKILASNKSNG
jgi:hypothetical protein